MLPPVPSPARVIPFSQLPCDCFPPLFKCNVATEAELPTPCSVDGYTLTVVNPEHCDHPAVFMCWGGEWYPLDCNGEPIALRVESNMTQVEYGSDAGETHGFKIGAATSWNTIYNYGGFVVQSTGDIIIPSNGIYSITGCSRVNHLVPAYPADDPPPTWQEAHFTTSLQAVRTSPPLATHICDQSNYALKIATAVPVPTPVGTIPISTDLACNVATEYPFLAGQVISLRQDYTDSIAGITGTGIWVTYACFTLRRVQ